MITVYYFTQACETALPGFQEGIAFRLIKADQPLGSMKRGRGREAEKHQPISRGLAGEALLLSLTAFNLLHLRNVLARIEAAARREAPA